MSKGPRDIVDIYLSPVALSLDEKLEYLATLSPEKLRYEVALETSDQPKTREGREMALLKTVTHLVNMHGWETGLSPRGLVLSHGEHRLTLGLSESLRDYLEGRG